MSRSSFMPLSDEDDGDGHFTLDDESPRAAAADAQQHRRSSSAEGGHFYAASRSTAGLSAAQRQSSSGSGQGALGNALARGPGPGNVQDALQVIKTKGLGLASFLREKAGQASSSVADPASRQQTLSRFRVWGAGAAERVQSATAQGLQNARELTSEGIKRLYGGPLAAICKAESAARPCPRAILVLCTTLVSSGLQAEGLFLESAPDELMHFLLGSLEEGQGLALPPPGTDPIVAAAALKHFLLTLPEPLFAHKCLPAIIAAGQEQGAKGAAEALAALPPASLNALTLLLETWHRVAEQSAANGMDARALAVAVTPCLAWAPPMAREARKDYTNIGVPEYEDGSSWRRGAAQAGPDSAADDAGGLGRSDLEPHDLAAVIAVVEFAITHFRGSGSDFDGPLYDYGSSPSAQQAGRPASPPAAQQPAAQPGKASRQEPDLLGLSGQPAQQQRQPQAAREGGGAASLI